jgi:lipopolysaccharide export system permease protein
MSGLTMIQRYILRRFFSNLLLCLVSVLVIYVVLDYVGKINRFSRVPLHVAAYYYLFVLPSILNLVISIIMLLAVMFTMGGLAKHSEITAMRSAGLSIFYISRPVLYFALLLAVSNILFNETLLPKVNRLRERKYAALIRQAPPPVYTVRYGFIYLGKDNILYYFKGRYDTRQKRGEDVDIEFYDHSKLYKRISCKSLEWVKGRWIARSGTERTFFEDSLATESFSIKTDFPRPIRERPEDILKEKKLPEEMNFLELRNYIQNLVRTGENPQTITRLRAELQYKLSLPFITFIVVIVGVSLTVKVGRSGIAKVFGLGILIGFIYYFLVNLGVGLGQSGTLNPVLGAWLGNLIFLPLSLIHFWKVTKKE